jgi:chromate transporter
MLPSPRPSIRRLFASFFRLGLTAFGGPSMVAYIRALAVEKHRWLDDPTFTDGVALCQSIPGATAMQVAAYVGLRAGGVRGAAASFVGFGLPAFVLMTFLAAMYARVHSLPAVIAAFSGLQAAIVAIVANATVSFGRTSLRSWRHALIALAAALLFGLRLNPIAVILLAGLAGFAFVRAATAPSKSSAGPPGQPASKRPLLIIVSCAAAGFLALLLFAPALFKLAALMFRIDLFAFGGGFASVPLMYHEIVQVRGWVDGPTFLNGIVLGQVTPGPIVITATFVGYLLRGLPGALVATAGVFLPSFLGVVALVPYLDRLKASRHFASVTGGILCSFVGLLLTVTIRFAGNVHWDVVHLLLAVGAFVALLRRVDILWVVVAATVVSVVVLR